MNFQPDKLSRRQMDILLLLADSGLETAALAQTLQRTYADPPPTRRIREDLHLLLADGFLTMEGLDDKRVWKVTETGEGWLQQRREWEHLVSGTAETTQVP